MCLKFGESGRAEGESLENKDERNKNDTSSNGGAAETTKQIEPYPCELGTGYGQPCLSTKFA